MSKRKTATGIRAEALRVALPDSFASSDYLDYLRRLDSHFADFCIEIINEIDRVAERTLQAAEMAARSRDQLDVTITMDPPEFGIVPGSITKLPPEMVRDPKKLIAFQNLIPALLSGTWVALPRVWTDEMKTAFWTGKNFGNKNWNPQDAINAAIAAAPKHPED